MSPSSYGAHLESGVALDLKSDYAVAREHLKKAIEVAPADQKNRALRVMAISYAFERNSAEAEKYEKLVFDALIAKSDFEAAAGVANELAHIKLESGDIDGAANWYKIGYDTAMRKTEMKDVDKNLWTSAGRTPPQLCGNRQACSVCNRCGKTVRPTSSFAFTSKLGSRTTRILNIFGVAPLSCRMLAM